MALVFHSTVVVESDAGDLILGEFDPGIVLYYEWPERLPLSKENAMFPSVKEIRTSRKKFNGQMFKSGIQLFRQIGEIETQALSDGVLSQRHKELIALGISISKGCYG